ncbi:MAG: DNRLRE domain-containing protein [Planctomycetota bacterium]|nr:DNRLRE domain-containing protein [Planctomycetota bacterium]
MLQTSRAGLLFASSVCLGSSLAAQTFTVIGLPDTQNYSESFPHIYHQQTQWIANSRQSLDIRYVSHYGDLVCDSNSMAEWAVADAAMATLETAGIPHGVTPGNHDITPSGIYGSPYLPQNYLNVFGPHRYTGQSWHGGASPTGMSSWQTFEAGGQSFLSLHLECDTPLHELQWAQGVLDKHRDKIVLLTTHRYLQDAASYVSGVPLVPSGRYPNEWYQMEGTYSEGGVMSEQLFDWFIRRNPNILLVQCGHFHEEYHQTSTNVLGEPVHEVLADYQDLPNGGDGWLRLMTFDTANHRIEFTTYSPFLNSWRTGSESQFSLPATFSSYRETRPTVVLQQGINGYQGTVDTWINQAAPNTVYSDPTLLKCDDDTSNSPIADHRGHALIRFDDLIGNGGQGFVPPGSNIISAHLTVEVRSNLDNKLKPNFFVYRSLTAWDENSTWNTMTNGLQASELSPTIGVFKGSAADRFDGLRRIDVTAAVQAWANGAPNYGFALLPEILPSNDDGIELLSSNSDNPLLRPRLEIVLESDCGFRGYGGNNLNANSMNLVGIGEPTVGGHLDLITDLCPTFDVLTVASMAPGNFNMFGGTVLVDPVQMFGVETISPRLSVPIPFVIGLAGTQIYCQSFAPDALLPQGVAMSNGLEITLTH